MSKDKKQPLINPSDMIPADEFTMGFKLGQKHRDCPEFKAILEEMEQLTVRMFKHAKECKK